MSANLQEILRTNYKSGVMEYMDSNPGAFYEAIDLALSEDDCYNWRGAWVLGLYISDDDERMKPFLNQILGAIKGKADNHQREFIKILLKMELDENQEGALFNICVDMWEDISKKPAIRYYAIKYMLKLAKKYPELNNELDFFLQERFFTKLSHGMKRSIMQSAKRR